MRTTLLLVTGGIFMLVAMAGSLFLLGSVMRGARAEAFKPAAFVLTASLFTLPVAWVCGYIFSRREAADKNRPTVIRHLLSLPFYAVSVHGLLWVICLALSAHR